MLRRWLPCNDCVLWGWLLCVLSRSAGLWASGIPVSNVPSFALWDKSINLRAGIGYRDNVLWSSVKPEGSAFVASGMELMLLRTDANGLDVYLFLSGEDLHYLSSVGVAKEQTLAVNAQIKKSWPKGWQTSLDLQYLYLDQMFDVSDTEADRSAVLAQGHALSLRPACGVPAGSVRSTPKGGARQSRSLAQPHNLPLHRPAEVSRLQRLC